MTRGGAIRHSSNESINRVGQDLPASVHEGNVEETLGAAARRSRSDAYHRAYGGGLRFLAAFLQGEIAGTRHRFALR